jgi:hypothetical protein
MMLSTAGGLSAYTALPHAVSTHHHPWHAAITTAATQPLTRRPPRRPTGKSWEDRPSALVPVRSVWQDAQGRRDGGFKLLTLRKKILETELVD